MKILVVSNYYPPHYFGGYELACKATTDFLINRGHSIFILTGIKGVENKPSRGPIQESVPYRCLEYIDYVNASAAQKSRVEKANYALTSRIINQVRPDIVYFWNVKAISIAPVLAAQALRQKKIFEIGDFWPGTYLRPGLFEWAKRTAKQIIPFTIGGAMDVSPCICVSRWMKQEMMDRFGTKKVYVVWNGIPIPDEVSRPPVTDGAYRFMFSGRLDPEKGVDIAIRALEIVEKKGITNWSFDVFGSGDEAYTEKCHALSRESGLADKIHFMGRVNDIYDRYAAHDALLMPTMMREPFGLVLVEAMAHSMVVIASNHYGPAEIVKHPEDGLLFNPGDPRDMAEKIILVLRDEELRNRICVAARRRAVHDFNILKVKCEVESILEKEIKLQ